MKNRLKTIIDSIDEILCVVNSDSTDCAEWGITKDQKDMILENIEEAGNVIDKILMELIK